MSTQDVGRPRILGFEMKRRDFLILGSAAAVGLAATAAPANVDGGTESMPLLSIGFCNAIVSELRDDARRSVVSADRLVAADARIASSGARITVHGFHRAATHRSRPLEVAFRTYYPAIDPATNAKTPFFPWVWRSAAQGLTSSNRTSFVVPVDLTDSLVLGVDRIIETPQPVTPLRRMSRFLAGSRNERFGLASLAPRTGANGLKLRRGTYYVAVREDDADAAPSWMSLRPTAGGALRTSAGSEPAFSYLVLSIEAATT